MEGKYRLTSLLENAKLPFLNTSPNKVLLYLPTGHGSEENLRSEFDLVKTVSVVISISIYFP